MVGLGCFPGGTIWILSHGHTNNTTPYNTTPYHIVSDHAIHTRFFLHTTGSDFGVGEFTTHFRTDFSGWIGMFTGGTSWILTHGHTIQYHTIQYHTIQYHIVSDHAIHTCTFFFLHSAMFLSIPPLEPIFVVGLNPMFTGG